jgi:hypothetical protein
LAGLKRLEENQKIFLDFFSFCPHLALDRIPQVNLIALKFGEAMPNHFIHVEIPCTDFDKAKKFYEGVFGWKTSYVPKMDYMLFETGNGLGGGFYKSSEHTGKQGVVNYLEVEDIEKTLEAIQQHGGATIVPKTPVADSGWFALFGDQDGNVLGLWKDA